MKLILAAMMIDLSAVSLNAVLFLSKERNPTDECSEPQHDIMNINIENKTFYIVLVRRKILPKMFES